MLDKQDIYFVGPSSTPCWYSWIDSSHLGLTIPWIRFSWLCAIHLSLIIPIHRMGISFLFQFLPLGLRATFYVSKWNHADGCWNFEYQVLLFPLERNLQHPVYCVPCPSFLPSCTPIPSPTVLSTQGLICDFLRLLLHSSFVLIARN